MNKPFDTALYESDDDAKFLVIRWLESRGHQVCVNPDEYGIDLLGSWNGRRYVWEVEVKHNWQGFEFPFDSVHYSVRKRKFVDPDSDVRTYFVTLNHERTRLLAVSGKDVMEARIIQKSTIYTQDEWFMEIPIRRAIFVDLNKEGL